MKGTVVHLFTSSPPAALALAAFLPAAALAEPAQAGAEGEKALPRAEGEARETAREYVSTSARRYKDLQRLKKDLRYISEELDRETLGERKTLDYYSQAGLERLAELRRRGNIDPRLDPALDKLEALYRSLPQRQYAKHYPRGLVKAVAHELRWIAENGATDGEILRWLEERLELPADVDAQGWLREDVPPAAFMKQGPIKVFLAKHRLRRPKGHARTTAEDIVAGRHNVQIGVELEGTVARHNGLSIDLDYTFDWGGLHIELTPEWRLTHPKLPKPRAGDRVRVRGWTYYDYFHKDEEEFDPDDPFLGLNRPNVWEVHPVQDIEVVSPAATPAPTSGPPSP